ncbi:thioredoxin family protein [Synechocystis sp. PCC 7509]|uniref:thioredoxin family protein n=1 Tax=Synechocystis sp. PCC 7509 TaxID=927677 RepID=UPI0002ACFE57|nr:thioredoxin family protein [Synechocystis sp. PCC 7509]
MTSLELTPTAIGSYAPDFEIRGTDSEVHHLARYLEKFKAVGVVFMANNSADVKMYVERLKNLQTAMQGQGFTLIGINPHDGNQDPEESFENMKKFAIEQKLNFPYLWDSTQDVTRSFGAPTIPMVFLLDATSKVRYRGAIDDNNQANAVKSKYLEVAITALMKGEAIEITATEAVGSEVRWR